MKKRKSGILIQLGNILFISPTFHLDPIKIQAFARIVQGFAKIVQVIWTNPV